ncbi:hypothetical protein HK100_006614, partial [Physocladia obscura]
MLAPPAANLAVEFNVFDNLPELPEFLEPQDLPLPDLEIANIFGLNESDLEVEFAYSKSDSKVDSNKETEEQ